MVSLIAIAYLFFAIIFLVIGFLAGDPISIVISMMFFAFLFYQSKIEELSSRIDMLETYMKKEQGRAIKDIENHD